MFTIIKSIIFAMLGIYFIYESTNKFSKHYTKTGIFLLIVGLLDIITAVMLIFHP